MRRILLLCSSLFCLAVFAPSAGAATNLGATFEPQLCSAGTTYIQTADPGNRYMVPADGVLTSWSYQALDAPQQSIRLKVGRAAPGADLTTDADVTITAQSESHTPTAGQLNTFSTRVPVKAGDRIGESFGGTPLDLAGCSREDNNFTDHFFSDQVPPGDTETFAEENFQQNIAAVWEPDADHDGFGDETQDKCATNAGTQLACPATAKKKCKKKKHRRSAESAKKKKCKKKRK